MTDLLPVRIKLGPTGVGAGIWINGMDVAKYVQGIELHSTPFAATELTLKFVKIEVDIEGPVGERDGRVVSGLAGGTSHSRR